MAKRKTKKISSARIWPLSLLPQPLIPEAARVFIAKRTIDGIAISLIVFAIFGVLSNFTYSPTDPAWNVASNSDIQNWMGSWGALTADVSLQTIGYGIFGFFVVVGLWGYRLFKRDVFVIPTAIRITSLIFGVFALSTAFARISAPESWGSNLYLGGAIGAKTLNQITNLLPFMHTGTALISGLIGIALCGLAVGYPWQSWKNGTSKTGATISFIVYKIKSACGWVSHYDAMSQTKTNRIEKPEKQKIIPKMTEAIESVAEKVMDTAIEPLVVKPKQNDKPTPQKSLNLKPCNDDWDFPPLDLLQDPPVQKGEQLDDQALQRNAMMLQQVLEDFSVQGEIVKIHPGPVVTLYELEPAPGTKSSRVIGLADDIARSMSAISVRCAVVPGRNVIGIEIPNKHRAIVYMRDVLSGKEYQDTKCKLPLVLGKDIGGQPIIADLARMPHLLVAGTTGSGKSVAVNTMLLSLLYKLPPEKCRFIMIDPKMLELSVYNDSPHLLSPVVTEPGKAVVALKWAVNEMEERYRAMSKVGVRNIDGYNERIKQAREKGEVLSRRVQTGFDPDTGKPTYEEQPIELVELPYIVIIVDEFADLMLVAGKEVENTIQRLAQMARAAGLHIIMATQRPSVDVITGVIKANFPTRISFQVTSKIDSRTILGEGGAEQLLGMGDMLFMAGGGQIKRVHGPFVADDEVGDVVNHVKSQGEPDYMDTSVGGGSDGGNGVFDMFGEGGDNDESVDELYDEAVAIIAREGKASTSFIQRHLQIGYNRAARIIEEMERQGVVSPATATGKREVLVGER
jgi:S-DNA-T family DNA segregation ATPase FtsK/SpoIIIE